MIHAKIFNDKTIKCNDINRGLNLLRAFIVLENDKRINGDRFPIIFYLKFQKVTRKIISISKNNIHVWIDSLYATTS